MGLSKNNIKIVKGNNKDMQVIMRVDPKMKND